MGKVLIIDDENQLRGLLARIIGLEGYEVIQADSCKAGLKQVEQQNPDVIICDVRLPDGSGVDLITEMKRLGPLTEIILLTVHGNIPDGVQAIKNGAFDYITKGDDNNKIIPLLSRAMEKVEMARRLQQLEKQVGQKYSFESILGKSKPIRMAVELARKVSVTDVPVLLTGETGTGKEVFAQAIHQHSSRAGKAFVAVNCSAFSKELLESEIFGHKAGAFTGALKEKKGLFEEADQGTIFLDEIGEMSPRMQAKLLRFLNDGTFRRVGEDHEVHVDVRVICATQKNLVELVQKGIFREDLYYRLNVLTLNIPPLRDCLQDIMPLTELFVARFADEQGVPRPKLSADLGTVLMRYGWPGNIRQLKNAVYRALTQLEGYELRPQDILLPDYDAGTVSVGEEAMEGSLDDITSRFERSVLTQLYRSYPSTRKLAKRLGVSHTAIANKLREYGLNHKKGDE